MSEERDERYSAAMRRLKVLACLSLLGFLGCSGATGADAESISELIGLADQANTRFEVKNEERYLRVALRLDGSGRERAEARRKLARVRWKFHQDYREASELLSEAVEVGAEVAKAWAERAEMERLRGRLAEAMAAAEKAVASAQGAFQRRAAVMALSAAVIDQMAQQRFDGGAEAGGDVAARVARALELQRALVRSQPGDPDTAKAMLSLAVALNRPQDAREAWRGYYFVVDDEEGPGLVAAAGRRLDGLYADWRGAATPVKVRAALAEALADSRFYLEAALVVLDPEAAERDALLAKPRVREIVAYARFCRRLRELTDEFYRQQHLGKEKPERYQELLAEATAELWQDLDAPSTKPPLRNGRTFTSAIRRELGPRFGAFGSLSNRDLYFGHTIVRDTRTVEQYGHRATVTYTVIDHTVSNGYQTWAWSSLTEVGGWATADSIVKVRSGLMRETVHVWDLYSSKEERSAIEQKMRRDSVTDDERARRGGVAYLPGLHMRMALRAIEDLVARLKAEGVAEEDLRLAFIKELLLIGDESGIFAHEGRHAIDLTLDASQKSPELEFTAKLSQVAFSRAPRISVIGILGQALGDDTPHGRANLKFAQGAVAWMKAHEDEIKGFDQSRPHFPQMDLLTDQQLIEVAQSMDPLVNGSGAN